MSPLLRGPFYIILLVLDWIYFLFVDGPSSLLECSLHGAGTFVSGYLTWCVAYRSPLPPATYVYCRDK